MSGFGAYQTTAATKDGRMLTLNRPDKLNAVGARMHEELSTIFDEVNLDASVDFVVLTGAGRAFSAGGDAAWMRELADVPGEWQRKVVEEDDLVSVT